MKPVEQAPPSDFDLLLAGDADARPDVTERRRGWVWIPALSVAVGALVCAGAAIGLMMPQRPGTEAVGSAQPKPPTIAQALPEPYVTAPARSPISELADRAWVRSLSEATAIPERVLSAYTGASIQVGEETPQCGIGWNTLAGIGFVESEHGTIHGSVIGDDGVAHPGIIGIALTGETTLTVRDTDGGDLDGDAVWDRAVGPMQFIPATWAQWGADGDDDGVRDPQNIDDSTLAAARYLCASGGDLTDPQNWIAAVHAYNPSVEYNNRVADAAQHYAQLSAGA